MDQYIGKMLDNRYEILELIGSGGMANVYKAKCHRLNRLVAVKILKSDMAENPEICRRFRDESRAVAQLSHANIVSVYDVSTSNDVEYIVMELIDGITLKQYMARRGQMDWRESLHFITQIMRALSHAHSRGIIHRDIKPQNIMVLRDGSVKVADFGIACLQNTTQTLTQEALGSVHYISPEQARGERIDARSDIYSAGVVLYEMLTGRLPFEGDSAVSVAIQHLSSVPLSPRDIREDIPEALELICMKAMNPNIEKRYASADEMLEDLEKFRKNPDVDLEYIRADLMDETDEEPTRYLDKKEITAAMQAAGKHPRKKRVQTDEPDSEETGEKTGIAGTRDEKKKMAIIIGAFAAALVLIFVIFSAIFGNKDAGNGSTTHKVPNILGKTVEEAQEMEGIKGIFTIDVVGTKESSKYQAGQIISQDPVEGVSRKNNLTIQVYICAEQENYYMPVVAGQSEQDAKSMLNAMKLSLSIQVQEQESDSVAKGLAIGTSPAAGSQIRKGSSVILYISKGASEKPVTITNFYGMGEADAKALARNMGLTVGASSYEYSSAPSGTVIAQSIAQDTAVKEGDNIYFTISKGEEPVQKLPVPSVLGMSLENAQRILTNAGFSVGSVTEQHSDSFAAGTVCWQSEDAGTEAEAGTTISLVISLGPADSGESGGSEAPNS